MGLGQLGRLAHHADAALGRRRDDHLGAEEAHEAPTLDAEGLGHGDDERVALGRADHGEADAGIAAGRLDHGLAGLQLARLLRRLDDAEGQPVLDRAERIEGLDLDEEVDAGRRQAVDADDRGVPDGPEDGIETGHCGSPWSCPRAKMRQIGVGKGCGNDAGHRKEIGILSLTPRRCFGKVSISSNRCGWRCPAEPKSWMAGTRPAMTMVGLVAGFVPPSASRGELTGSTRFLPCEAGEGDRRRRWWGRERTPSSASRSPPQSASPTAPPLRRGATARQRCAF